MINTIKNSILHRIRHSPSNRNFPPHVTVMQGSQISSDTIIGDYTYVGFNCFITKAKIGRYCSVANNVSIGHGEHDLHKISTNSIFYDDPYSVLTKNDCVMGNDVWIGVDCIIRRGVRIGNGAVIGANSFVNKDIPDFAIAAGSPARIIRFRFSPEMARQITESNWWDLEFNEAKSVVETLEKKLVHSNNQVSLF